MHNKARSWLPFSESYCEPLNLPIARFAPEIITLNLHNSYMNSWPIVDCVQFTSAASENSSVGATNCCNNHPKNEYLKKTGPGLSTNLSEDKIHYIFIIVAQSNSQWCIARNELSSSRYSKSNVKFLLLKWYFLSYGYLAIFPVLPLKN